MQNLLSVLDSIFQTSENTTISLSNFLFCILAALIIGAIYYFTCAINANSTNTFKIGIALLPVATTMTCLVVNGNIGIGIAVAGAFSLVRFRSAQGSAQDISILFLSMCSGLIIGTGYLLYALIFTIIVCVILIIYNYIITKKENSSRIKILKITIPEDLDYPTIFNDIFNNYLEHSNLILVKTADLGSLYRLTYKIKFKKDISEKQFVDDLRVKNGNLEISILREVQNENIL